MNFIKSLQQSPLFKQRLDRTKFTGLPLSIFSVAFLCLFILFLKSARDSVLPDIVIRADMYVNTLLYTLRNATTIKVFTYITLLGEPTTVVTLALIISIVLWLTHKKWQTITLWITIIGSEGLTFVAKWFTHRSRPINALFLEESSSLPSGHATIAVAFYGFLAYLLFKQTKNTIVRILIILVTLIIIIAIGFSRLYLGVHYVSDVCAGYLVGLLWLVIGISIAESKLPKK